MYIVIDIILIIVLIIAGYSVMNSDVHQLAIAAFVLIAYLIVNMFEMIKLPNEVYVVPVEGIENQPRIIQVAVNKQIDKTLSSRYAKLKVEPNKVLGLFLYTASGTQAKVTIEEKLDTIELEGKIEAYIKNGTQYYKVADTEFSTPEKDLTTYAVTDKEYRIKGYILYNKLYPTEINEVNKDTE